MRVSYASFQAQIRSTSCLAAQVVPRLAFFFPQPPFDDRLRGDAGVVGAGHPERVEALHPLHANQDVLQRVVQGVAQVQRAGHVGRRNHDRKGLAVPGPASV